MAGLFISFTHLNKSNTSIAYGDVFLSDVSAPSNQADLNFLRDAVIEGLESKGVKELVILNWIKGKEVENV